MGMNTKNRITNNPYLSGIVPDRASKLTFGSELKRLLGSPLRFPATLVFVLGPLLLTLAGTLDFLSPWLYSLAHHSQGDPRPVLNIFECFQDQTGKLCQGVVWASPGSPKRLTLYPWHDFALISRFEPYLFIGFLALAVIAFVAIGNPNLAKIGRNLKSVVGLKPKGAAITGSKDLVDLIGTATTGPVPRAVLDPARPGDFWRNHLLLGEFVPRYWESDPGYFWFDKEAGPVPYWLTLPVLRTGLIIVAPQGSGKTASIFKPLRNFMERSRSVGIFYDVKSSENANGTGTDFPPHQFTLNFDAALITSIKLNIFAGQTPAQAGERLAEALIPDLGGDKAYFSNNAKSAMAAIVACYHAVFHKYPSLVQILSFLSNPENLKDLNKHLNHRLTGYREAEAFRLSTLLRRIIDLSENKTTDTLGNLATALEPLVTDVAARLLVTNPEPNAYTIEELLKEPKLVRLALPVANNPRIYPIIGRLVLAQFTYAVLSPNCNRNIFKLIAVDEARHFITDNVANGMAQARSNNAGFALSFQTLTQVRDEILLDNIFANAGSKLVMGKVSDKDAERYSRLFGTIELPYVSHSAGENQGVNKNSGNSYSRGSEFEMISTGTTGHESKTTRSASNGRSTSSGSSQGTNLATKPRRRFLDSEVRELEQRHAIIESSDDQGQQWFAQVVNMDFHSVQEIERQVNKQITRLLKKAGKGKSKQGHLSDNPVQTGQMIKIRVLHPIPAPASASPPAPAQVPQVVTTPKVEIITLPAAEAAGATENIPIAAAPAGPPLKPAWPPPQPQVTATSSSSSSSSSGSGSGSNNTSQPDPLKQLLATAGIGADDIDALAGVMVANGRTLAELNHLLDVSKHKNSDDLGAVIASLILKDTFPKDTFPAVIKATHRPNRLKRP